VKKKGEEENMKEVRKGSQGRNVKERKNVEERWKEGL
jgi:hypothetical protein